MSRLPLSANLGQVPTPGDVLLLIDHVSSITTVSSLLVKNRTQRDPVISKVCQFVQRGWPDAQALDVTFRPYIS